MTRFYLTHADNAAGVVVTQGCIYPTPNFRHPGWYDYRSFTQNGSSRKPKRIAEGCIPRKFTGYIIEAKDFQTAERHTKAFRRGEHWTIEAARIGDIRMVRHGKVV